MVRLGIYDNSSSPDKDTKQDLAFEVYAKTPIVSPYSLDAVNETKPDGTGDGTGDGDLDGSKDAAGNKPDSGPEDLGQVWWDFLGETSLHGCKNVKERQMIKRVVWGCFILAMAGMLSWALTNLFLRYKEHPFVSVWGFQRESKTPPPGLTFCIPAKFNKEKLKNARPAYKLLAYANGRNNFMLGDAESRLKGYETYFDTWRQELETITIRRSRWEIGFNKIELFWFSSLFIGNRMYKLMPVLDEYDGTDNTCWGVNWYRLNTSISELYVNDEELEEDMRYDYNDAKPDYHNESHKNASDNHYKFGTSDGVTMKNDDNEKKDSNFQSTTIASVLSARFLSSTETPPKQKKFNETSSPSNSGQGGGVGQNEGGEHEEQVSNGPDLRTGVKSTGDVQLSQGDSAVFLINIKQSMWHSGVHYAGMEVYLHDPAGPYWTENPLLLRPGTLSNIYYKTTKYKFLPLPYKSFGGIEREGSDQVSRNTGCVDTTSSSFTNKMVSLPKSLYSSEMCILETTVNRSTLACGCSLESFYNNLHGTKQCSIYKYITCFSKYMAEEYFKLQTQVAEGNDTDVYCPQACRMVQYESTVTTGKYPTMEAREDLMKMTGMSMEEIDDNILMLTLKPQGPLTVTVEHVPELTILGIVGSAGGWMGICLGASLLTLTELFEVLVMSVWILYRKLTRRLRAARI